MPASPASFTPSRRPWSAPGCRVLASPAAPHGRLPRLPLPLPPRRSLPLCSPRGSATPAPGAARPLPLAPPRSAQPAAEGSGPPVRGCGRGAVLPAGPGCGRMLRRGAPPADPTHCSPAAEGRADSDLRGAELRARRAPAPGVCAACFDVGFLSVRTRAFSKNEGGFSALRCPEAPREVS